MYDPVNRKKSGVVRKAHYEETGEVILPSYVEAMNSKKYLRLIERDKAVGLRVINFKGRAELLSVTSYNGQPVKLVMVPYFDFN